MVNVLPKFDGMTNEEICAAIERFPFSVGMYNPTYGINMGAILRSCNAFGATQFIRIGKKKFDRRAAIGVQNYETIQHFQTWDDSLKWMRLNNYRVYGVDYVEGVSTPIHTIGEYPGHSVFLMGSERNGLPQEVMDSCDQIIHIDQFGSIPSLNVAQAASIIMYNWHEKRRNPEATINKLEK